MVDLKTSDYIAITTSAGSDLIDIARPGVNNFKQTVSDFTTQILSGVSATPGGSSGQLQWNSSSTFAGAAFSTVATSGTHLTLTAQTASDKPLVLKGATSQTANLLELQNTAGGQLAFFNSSGHLYLGGNIFDYLSSPGGGGSFGWTTPFAGTVSFTQQQSGQQIVFRCITAENKIASFTHYDVANVRGRLFEISSDAGVFMSVAPSNLEMLRLNGFGTADITSPANWVITSPFAAKQTLIVRGAASQSANLQEWQNSASTVLANVSSAGVLTAVSFSGAGTGLTGTAASLTVGNVSDNAITTAKILNANVTIAKLAATGTPSSTTFLRGDNVWAVPSGGGGGSQEVYIQDAKPTVSGPTIWVETGLGSGGNKFRLWALDV